MWNERNRVESATAATLFAAVVAASRNVVTELLTQLWHGLWNFFEFCLVVAAVPAGRVGHATIAAPDNRLMIIVGNERK
jgi:hypothetical protein